MKTTIEQIAKKYDHWLTSRADKRSAEECVADLIREALAAQASGELAEPELELKKVEPTERPWTCTVDDDLATIYIKYPDDRRYSILTCWKKDYTLDRWFRLVADMRLMTDAVNAYKAQETCGTCQGKKAVDSGGVTPWGSEIFVPCPECAEAKPDIKTQLDRIEDRLDTLANLTCDFCHNTGVGSKGEVCEACFVGERLSKIEKRLAKLEAKADAPATPQLFTPEMWAIIEKFSKEHAVASKIAPLMRELKKQGAYDTEIATPDPNGWQPLTETNHPPFSGAVVYEMKGWCGLEMWSITKLADVRKAIASGVTHWRVPKTDEAKGAKQ